MLIVDIRAYGTGTADETDMLQMAYGPDAVTPETALIWIGPDGKQWPIRGVFDPSNTQPGSQNFRDRVHFLGLVTERTYARDELQHAIKFFYNPNLLSTQNAREILSRFPLHSPSLDRSNRPEDYLGEHHEVMSDNVVQHALVIDGKTLVYRVRKELPEDLAEHSIANRSDLDQTFWRHQNALERVVRAKFCDTGPASDGTISIDPRDKRYLGSR